jgi:hypothetical protein
MPSVIMPGIVYRSTTVGLTNDYQWDDTAACKGQGGGAAPDGVFQITIPANGTVTVTVTPLADMTGTSWDPVINLIAPPSANCGTLQADGGTIGMVCLGGVDTGFIGEPETTSTANVGATPKNVFIVVDGYNGSGGAFTLVASISPAQQGEACANAVPITITDGGVYDAGTTLGFGNDIYTDMNCTMFRDTGPDKIFSVTIPPMQTLTATVNPEATFDPSLYLTPGPTCPARLMMCLASADMFGPGVSETITYANSTAAAQSVFLVVDRFIGGAGGAFTLQISIR